MTLQMRPKPQLGLKPPVNVLLYGPAGSGKTTGALSAPGGILDLNFENPNATYFARARMAEDRVLEPEIPQYEEDAQGRALPSVVTLLNEVATEVTRQRADNEPIIDTVVIDPLHELHRRLLEEMSNRAMRPTLPTFGDVEKTIERFCRFLCEAPINVVLVAHDRAVRDESTGEFDRLPFTGTSSPNLGLKLAGLVDVVAYCGVKVNETGQRQYVAQLVDGGGRRGKDRFGVLGDFRPLDLAEWFEAIGNPLNEPEPLAVAA